MNPFSQMGFIRERAVEVSEENFEGGFMGIHCGICKRPEALIRVDELETAAISRRAHVDCAGGHSEYRYVSANDIIVSRNKYRIAREQKVSKAVS